MKRVSKNTPSERNRERTEQEILDALKQQIREEGMLRTGINAVAKRANVSKELIYRYFGGMEGLFLTMMRNQDYWTRGDGVPSPAEVNGQSAGSIILMMLRDQMNSLRANDVVQEVRRWELLEPDETRQKLAKRRETVARRFIEDVAHKSNHDDIDIPAVTGLLLAGVLYLTLRSKTEDHFLGVPLRTERGWQRFSAALETIVERTLPSDGDARPSSKEDDAHGAD